MVGIKILGKHVLSINKLYDGVCLVFMLQRLNGPILSKVLDLLSEFLENIFQRGQKQGMGEKRRYLGPSDTIVGIQLLHIVS